MLGLNEGGSHWIQVYRVIGLSANSRNRVLKAERAEVMTGPQRTDERLRPVLSAKIAEC